MTSHQTSGNVVPLQVWKDTRPRKIVTTVEVIIDDTRPLEEGDLVAFTWPPGADGKTWPTMFGWWEGATGRDGNGRFAKRGSDDECCSLGFMRYTAKDVKSGRLRILGKVIYGMEPVRTPFVVPESI